MREVRVMRGPTGEREPLRVVAAPQRAAYPFPVKLSSRSVAFVLVLAVAATRLALAKHGAKVVSYPFEKNRPLSPIRERAKR